MNEEKRDNKLKRKKEQINVHIEMADGWAPVDDVTVWTWSLFSMGVFMNEKHKLGAWLYLFFSLSSLYTLYLSILFFFIMFIDTMEYPWIFQQFQVKVTFYSLYLILTREPENPALSLYFLNVPSKKILLS